jgi:hypothetical protein
MYILRFASRNLAPQTPCHSSNKCAAPRHVSSTPHSRVRWLQNGPMALLTYALSTAVRSSATCEQPFLVLGLMVCDLYQSQQRGCVSALILPGRLSFAAYNCDEGVAWP